ncbi:WRKY transcription factor 19 [Phytophthora cinnamomi]|uniref:WRKY transcription factor 19 n=1 Tax=Phytophthora cinnamomi TaxID=4785 RepID=UPI00355AA017|nr:WRKY transcription factor 19 [Phytophthora cinnamomi]
MSAETRSPSASPSASSDGGASPSSSAHARTSADGKPKKCRFNDCDNLAVDGTSKCAFHKNRRQCCVENCTNQVYARKLCVRHGGKKQCQADNCEAHARGGGFCLQHGGFVVKRFCIVEGCSKQAHARQKCVRHGGGRRCKVDGCMQHARAGGLCNRHSHGHECRVDGCNKTAQHSGSICFRHAMELRAHGEEVPELNISKGGRLSSKKRQQQQREQQMKQEQFHHQQIQQQIHQPQPHMQPHHAHMHVPASHHQQQQHAHPLTIQVPQSQPMPQQSQQQQQQQAANPFGLPLKINVPTTMPKFSLRTPLGNSFPTPRSHEFSLLMGLPSPQIDNSQLPSVLAMTNAGAGANGTSSGQRTPGIDSFLASGPPSVSRGGSNYLSLGLFPTPRLADRTPGGSDDAMMSDYIKLMGPDTPMAFHPNGQFGSAPLLENIGANVFDQNNQNHQNGANGSRNHMAAMAAAAAVHGSGNGQQRMKMDFLSPRGLAAHNFQSAGFPASTSDGPAPSGDYAAQFFADSKNDKARGMKTSSVSAATTPTPKPTGVTAA